MDYGSNMTLTLSSVFPLLIIAGRSINDTCSAWLVLCVCSRGLRLLVTGAGSQMFTPVACRVLGSSLAALLVGKLRHTYLVGLVIGLSNDGECFHKDSCCG